MFDDKDSDLTTYIGKAAIDLIPLAYNDSINAPIEVYNVRLWFIIFFLLFKYITIFFYKMGEFYKKNIAKCQKHVIFNCTKCVYFYWYLAS